MGSTFGAAARAAAVGGFVSVACSVAAAEPTVELEGVASHTATRSVQLDRPGRASSVVLGPQVHVYGDGAHQPGWVTSSAWAVVGPGSQSPGSGAGSARFTDEFVIQADGLDGQRGTLKARFGANFNAYGNAGGPRLRASGWFANNGVHPGAPDWNDGLIERQFRFGEPIGIDLRVSAYAETLPPPPGGEGRRVGGWAAFAWHGLAEVSDINGNLVPLDRVTVTSDSGFNYRLSASEPQTQTAPAAAYLAADANDDGRVDVADLGALATNFNAAADGGRLDADFDYSGQVDVADLGILATNFNRPAAAAAGPPLAQALAAYPELLAAVPEPGALGLLAAAGGLCLAPRRRRRGRAAGARRRGLAVSDGNGGRERGHLQ